MASDLPMSAELEQIAGEISDIFRALSTGFQKLDKIKRPNRRTKQLEELTGKMREYQESQNPPGINRQLNEKKKFMIKVLNSYVVLRKTYTSSLGKKRVELFDMGAGGSDPVAEDHVQMASVTYSPRTIRQFLQHKIG